jgi:hypothetical protein
MSAVLRCSVYSSDGWANCLLKRRNAGLSRSAACSSISDIIGRLSGVVVGAHLAEQGRLDRADDVFFLDLHEARCALGGEDFRATVAARRERYTRAGYQRPFQVDQPPLRLDAVHARASLARSRARSAPPILQKPVQILTPEAKPSPVAQLGGRDHARPRPAAHRLESVAHHA